MWQSALPSLPDESHLASLVTFKKFQSLLAEAMPPQALRVEGNQLFVVARETAELARALGAAKSLGLREPDIQFERSNFNRVERIDLQNCLVTAGATTPLDAVEHALDRAGLTLGAISPGARKLTVGDWLEGPYAGLRPIPGARLEAAPLVVEAALRNGHVYRSHPSPRSASGPDLDHLLLGGGAEVGLITRAVLRSCVKPTTHERCSARMNSTETVRDLLWSALASEAVPERATIWAEQGRWLVQLSFSGLAFRVHRDSRRTRVAVLTRSAEVLEQKDAPAVDSNWPESEVSWEALPKALESTRGEPVALYRIARESVICASAKLSSTDGVVPMSGSVSRPPWAKQLLEAARGTP